MGAGIAPTAAHDTLARAIGDPSAALPVGRREQLAVAGEQIALARIELREHACVERRAALDRAVLADVLRVDAALEQRAAHEDRAMTVERIALRAEQRDAPALRGRRDALEPLREPRRSREALVVDAAVDDARGIVRARAELLADERIRDAGGLERRAQALRAELWSKATNGVRTHVGDFGDAVRAQQLEELLERMVRVADRADVGHRARLSSNVVSAPPVRSAARAGRARARRDPARGP